MNHCFFGKIYLLVSLSNFNLSAMQKWGILLILLYTLSACTYTEKIRDGKTAYERKQFTVANQLLTNEIKKVKRLKNGQRTKGVGWIPRHLETKKGVVPTKRSGELETSDNPEIPE